MFVGSGCSAYLNLQSLSLVMAGLVPATHVLLAEAQEERRGCPRQARA
jgi:hypothetical protein